MTPPGRSANRAFVNKAVKKAKLMRDPKPCPRCYRPCLLADGLWVCPTHGELEEQAPR